MSSILFSLPEIFAAYKNWISRNPQLASDYEASVKWISYFIAGKINNSQVLSELVYCLSNLLVFFNDRIINNTLQLELPNAGTKLKLWLTTVEYCEVLFELTSEKIWGQLGKWLVIIGIQVFKCISRLILIHNYKETIIQNPPIPVLNRNNLTPSAVSNNNTSTVAELAQAQRDSIYFTLKSGRVVRKVEASPPISLRSWKPVQHQEFDNEQTVEQTLAGRQLLAETIYIIKPIAHIATLTCFGDASWKPWMLSFLLDVTSLQLYFSCKGKKTSYLTAKQRLQLSKRKFILLMYLLRSPFYDRHSQSRIHSLLESTSKNVPLARLICGPIAQYLPFWQKTYFYMWST